MGDITTTPVILPASDTSKHHFNLSLFLQALIAIAPAVAAPFIKNPQTANIVATEAGVASAIAQALGKQ